MLEWLNNLSWNIISSLNISLNQLILALLKLTANGLFRCSRVCFLGRTNTWQPYEGDLKKASTVETISGTSSLLSKLNEAMVTTSLKFKKNSITLVKWCKMFVHKVLTHISLWSPHRLIRDNIFRLNWIVVIKSLPLNQKYKKSGKPLPWLAYVVPD